MSRVLLLCGGWISLGCALVGAVLPLVPTTPFALLAAWCFARSSPSALRRLVGSRTLGPLIADWRRERGIRPRAKQAAVLFILGSVVLSVIVSTLCERSPFVALLGGAISLLIVSRLRVIAPPQAATLAAQHYG